MYKLLIALFVDSSGSDAAQCGGCNQEIDKCQCQMIVYMFHETNRKLIELELLERLVGNVLTSLIHIRIKCHVSETCDRVFDVSQLKPLENVSPCTCHEICINSYTFIKIIHRNINF